MDDWDSDKLDAIGKAFGYALAVYDQTKARGGQLDRINDTMRTLIEEAADHDLFSDDVANLLSGVGAGLFAYSQVAMRDKAGLDGSEGPLL